MLCKQLSSLVVLFLLIPYYTPSVHLSSARKHIVAYLNAWFLANTKRNRNGKHGISDHDVQDLANDIIDRMETGEESFLFDFRPTGSNNNIQVAVSSSDMLWLQKMDPDPSSQKTRQLCKGLVAATSKTMASAQKSSRPAPGGYRTFVTGNEHCFTLPFVSTNPSQLLACGMHSTEISNHRDGSNGNGNYFWNSLRDTIGRNPIIINGMDVRTLLPETWLNDSIVNFWMKWVGIPQSPNDLASQVYVFSSHFLSSVLLNSYSSDLKRWLRKINIFDKKLLLFPFHGVNHWSLVAVYNPSLIKQTSKRWGDASYTNEVSCMVHFDSLGRKTTHNRSDIAWAIRLVLNSEWDRHYNTSLDKTSRPFTHRCLPLLTPKVVCQDNSFDCGMFTCRYAFNAIQLLKKRLTMNDVHHKLKCHVSEDSLFDFPKGDITRMRVEIHNILGSITEEYRSHRDTSAEAPAVTDVHDVATNLFNDSESDGEADNDDDDVAFTNDNHSSDCSGSVWSCGSDGDGDELMHDEDEPLIYESNGELIL